MFGDIRGLHTKNSTWCPTVKPGAGISDALGLFCDGWYRGCCEDWWHCKLPGYLVASDKKLHYFQINREMVKETQNLRFATQPSQSRDLKPTTNLWLWKENVQINEYWVSNKSSIKELCICLLFTDYDVSEQEEQIWIILLLLFLCYDTRIMGNPI